jgi:hypothetical protein
MNRILKLIFLFLFSIQILPQNSQGQSPIVKLNIKFPPPDTLSPEVSLKIPEVFEGYPIYSRDSIYLLSADISDDSKQTRIKINDKDLGNKSNGQTALQVGLKLGENNINFIFSDKSGNSTRKNIKFFYDPNADVTPPIIFFDPPFENVTRGIKVVPKDSFDSLVVISGSYSDQSNILGIWINGIKVDSISNNKFYYTFRNNVPDTIRVRIADEFGNLNKYSVVIESTPDFLIKTNLNQINYLAFIIAIDSYRDSKFNDLSGPIKDGENLAKVLSDYYNFNKRNIKILKNPTRKQIITTFDNYRKSLNENDNLLIFYAGHGFYDKETETGYWLPSDADADNTSNWIPNSAIRDYLNGIKTQHTLVISDACFASSLLREPFQDADRSINEIYKYKSRKAIVSGSDDAPDRSVFVEYLLKYLKSIDKPYFTAQDLFNKIKEPVINNSKTSQIPEYKSIPNTGDEGMSGDFIFARKTTKE